MSRQLFTKTFWLDTLERVIKTFAETWGALLVGSGLDRIDASLLGQMQVAALAALAALLLAVGATQVGDSSTASWLPAKLGQQGRITPVMALVVVGFAVLVVQLATGSL